MQEHSTKEDKGHKLYVIKSSYNKELTKVLL